ncbi:porin family protein [Flavobacterium sp. HSC-61S13]|uniref:porin family protein n=1 Tax=Flavobacterium sp. HSC-61S13 TaxID=2910963 RepID=UPI0020A20396|nr:porin family protein [Flavobacterium sp. HSC-61S13]MCP1995631.1 opacity protein-like surface antigen [Flavobacterium sp. HSC-61S13]
MKKITFTLLACTLFSGAIYAQTPDVKIGFKAGANFAKLTDGDLHTGFHLGGLAEIYINEKFSIQPELLYSAQGSESSSSASTTAFGVTMSGKGDSKLKLSYINIPIMAKYYVLEGLSIQAGPQVGFLVKAEMDYVGTTTNPHFSDQLEIYKASSADVKSQLNPIDFGINFGVGYEFMSGMFIDARYNLGLSKVPKESIGIENNYKNQVIQISLGYKF